MHYIPGLRIRLSDPESEIIGIDDAEMGEFAYDYVGIDTEIGGLEQKRESLQTEMTQQHQRQGEGSSVGEPGEK